MTRVVFRLGVIELGLDSVRIRNRTTDMSTGRPYDKTLPISPEQRERWRLWLTRRLAERAA